MIRVIFDANIYVSALLKPAGLQAQLLKQGLEGKFHLVLSELILEEICRVLNYEKIAKRLPFTKSQIKIFLERLVESTAWTADELKVSICEDPKDDIYLSCAKESQAGFLVSGDRDLLKLENFEDTRIVSSKIFLDYLSALAPPEK